MKRNYLIFVFVFLFATAMVGGAQAATLSQAGTPNILVGPDARTSSVSDITQREDTTQDLLTVETIDIGDIPNGLYDFLPPPRPLAPEYTNAGCNGDRYRYTITLLEPTTRWVYHSTPAGVFPSLPFATVGMLPPTQTPPENFPNLFQLIPLAQVVYATIISEFLYFGGQVFPLSVNSGSFCYEYGIPVAVRGDRDPTSRFRSSYDAVISRVTGRTLVIDVIKPSVPAGTSPGGLIVIPGDQLRVRTAGTEAVSGESGVPLRVTIQSINTEIEEVIGNQGNPGVTEETIAIATMISQDNPGATAGNQVVAEDGTLRNVIIGVDNQQASNIRIQEQVSDQFFLNQGSQIEISLPNGIDFTSPPQVSFSGGLTAFLNSSAGFPRNAIFLDVSDAGPATGVIRVHDVHLNVGANVAVGEIIARVRPTVNGNGVQSLRGLDDSSIAIAYAIPAGATVDVDDPLVRVNISASASDPFLLLLNVAPPQDTTGEIYVSFATDVAGLEDFLFFRPNDLRVPTPEGLWIVLVAEEGEFLPGAETNWWMQGALSSTMPDARFIIGGLTEDLVGNEFTVKSWWKAADEPLSDVKAIQEVIFTIIP
jgi:hypothetical protein